jgi:acetolactate synthase I/II/III large subunit
MVSCASAIVSLLQGYGVDTVFGIPGVHTIELYRALPASGIRHVTPRHEQGAAFMADGYARSTGRPGVCILISGPGLTNAATPIAQAFSDSVPMLIVSAVHRRKDIGLGRGYLHELKGQRELMAQITAFSHTLLDTANLREVLGRAFAVFGAARPRPVHIEVPIDLMDAEYSGSLVPLPIPAKPAPDPASIARAAEILSRAKRPLAIAGGGASGASVELLETIRRRPRRASFRPTIPRTSARPSGARRCGSCSRTPTPFSPSEPSWARPTAGRAGTFWKAKRKSSASTWTRSRSSGKRTRPSE